MYGLQLIISIRTKILQLCRWILLSFWSPFQSTPKSRSMTKPTNINSLQNNENGGRIGCRGRIRRFIFQRTRRHPTTCRVDQTESPQTEKNARPLKQTIPQQTVLYITMYGNVNPAQWIFVSTGSATQ